jgi:hypothetical protein
MKIKPGKSGPEKIKIKTKPETDLTGRGELAEWWKAEDDKKLAIELCSTAAESNL